MKAIELQKKIDKGLKVKIFDFRTAEKYDEFHITGAIHIKRSKLIENPDEYISKEEKVYITCNSGNSASRIAKEFRDKGYDVEHLEGGMNAMQNEKHSCDI